MRIAKGRRIAFGIVLGVVLAHGVALAQEEPVDETERWVPAFGVYSGALVQKASGSVFSSQFLNANRTDCAGPFPSSPVGPAPGPAPSCPNYVRPSVSGSDIMVAPFVGGTLELMAPSWTPIPGRPRLFVRGDLVALFAFDRSLAREGAPGKMVDPNEPDYPDIAVGGQGSIGSAEVQPLVASAGIGVAFTVDVWSRRLRIKPSFEWFREEVRFDGKVHRAVLLNPEATAPINSTFQFIEMRGSREKAFNGIGPGFELEVDTLRAGPFMMTLFASGQAYRILGDREVSFASSYQTTAPSLADQKVSGDWSFEKAAWTFRGGLGLRFRWIPE